MPAFGFLLGVAVGLALAAAGGPSVVTSALARALLGDGQSPREARRQAERTRDRAVWLLSAVFDADSAKYARSPPSELSPHHSPPPRSMSAGPLGFDSPPLRPLRGHSRSVSLDRERTPTPLPAAVAKSAREVGVLVDLAPDGMYSFDHVVLSARPFSGFMNIGFWLPLETAMALGDDAPAVTAAAAEAVRPTSDFATACENMTRLVAEAAQLRGKRVVDCGYGLGDSPLLLHHEYQCEVFGFTKSEQQAAIAQHRVARLGLASSVHLHQGDAAQVADLMAALQPHPPIDAVISIDSAYHYSTRAEFFEQAFRLLAASRVIHTQQPASAGTAAAAARTVALRRRSMSTASSACDMRLTAASGGAAGTSTPASRRASIESHASAPLPPPPTQLHGRPLGLNSPPTIPSSHEASALGLSPSPQLPAPRIVHVPRAAADPPRIATVDVLIPNTRTGRTLARIAGIPAANLGNILDYERALSQAGFTHIELVDVTRGVFPWIVECLTQYEGKWRVAGWVWWLVWRVAGAQVVLAKAYVQ